MDKKLTQKQLEMLKEAKAAPVEPFNRLPTFRALLKMGLLQKDTQSGNDYTYILTVKAIELLNN